MKKRPFFSIVIPTYNRANDLRMAVNSILKQDFDDYEIIISDNASTDNTKKICKLFNDERIKYLRNKTNIGFNRNLYKVIKAAKGQYVFMLGDDDFILKKSTLTNVFNKIKKNNYGIIRLKFIYQDLFKNLFSLYFKNIKSANFKKNKNNIEIIEFLNNEAIYSFISGLIFKNNKNIRIYEIENSKMSNIEISNFWLVFLFSATKSFGAYIDLDNPIIAKWAVYSNPEFYQVKDGKIPQEKIWKLLSNQLSEKEMKIWKEKETNQMILLFPSIKYYSNKRNLLLYAKRMSEINRKLLKIGLFYISLTIGFFMPKFMWRLIRKIYHTIKIVNEKEIINEYEKLKKEIINPTLS